MTIGILDIKYEFKWVKFGKGYVINRVGFKTVVLITVIVVSILVIFFFSKTERGTAWALFPSKLVSYVSQSSEVSPCTDTKSYPGDKHGSSKSK